MSVTGSGAIPLGVRTAATGLVCPAGAGAVSLRMSIEGIGYVCPAGRGAVDLHIVPEGIGVSTPAGTGTLSIGASITGTGAPLSSGAGAVSLGVTVAGVGSPINTGSGAVSAGVIVAGTDAGIGAVSVGVTIAATGWVGTAAAGRWLYLHTVPPAQIYSVEALRGRLSPALPAHRLDWAASDTRSEIGRTNDSWSARLIGANPDLRNRLTMQAPYGVRVDMYDGGTLIRTGVSTGVSYAERDTTIDVQSDIWTRDLPIRTSADLGTFRDVEPLPRRYGRAVPGRLISINAARTLWLWADHASLAIRSITIDGQPFDGWSWRNDIDAGGNPITIVQTVEQIDEGAELVAAGDGAMDSATGVLLVNPSDVARDLCRIAGLSVDSSDFAGYRAECLARNLELSGTIDGGSLQGALDTIAKSTHSAFARLLPGYLRLLPITAAASATISAASVLSSESDGDIATRLRVRYGIEESGPRRSLEVRAKAIERMYGVKLREVELPMIRDDRSAEDIAARMLQQLARPAYRIQCARQLREWLPGEVASVSLIAQGISGDAIVIASSIGDGSTPTLLLHAGTAPEITLITVAQAYTPEPYAGATVATQGNSRIITITDDTGAPIANAQCLLDGSMTRYTDGGGRVSFPISAMPPGVHTIDVIATGYSPFRLTVTI